MQNLSIPKLPLDKGGMVLLPRRKLGSSPNSPHSPRGATTEDVVMLEYGEHYTPTRPVHNESDYMPHRSIIFLPHRDYRLTMSYGDIEMFGEVIRAALVTGWPAKTPVEDKDEDVTFIRHAMYADEKINWDFYYDTVFDKPRPQHQGKQSAKQQ